MVICVTAWSQSQSKSSETSASTATRILQPYSCLCMEQFTVFCCRSRLCLSTFSRRGWTTGVKMSIFKASASRPLHLQVTSNSDTLTCLWELWWISHWHRWFQRVPISFSLAQHPRFHLLISVYFWKLAYKSSGMMKIVKFVKLLNRYHL